MSDVGEIVGRLRLDAGNWFTELERAETAARQLETVDPKVRVTAETKTAMSALDMALAAVREVDGKDARVTVHADVDAATADLNRAMRVADDVEKPRRVVVTADTAAARAGLEATRQALTSVTTAEQRFKDAQADAALEAGAAAAAETRLDELLETRARNDWKVVAAEEALDEATRRSDAAAEKAAVAEDRLAIARERSARAAVGESAAVAAAGAANDRGAKSANAFSGEARKQADALAVLIKVAVAFGPALIPVSAAAVGLTGALTGMGVAGALAISGLVRDAKTGAGAFSLYKPAIDDVVADVHRLQDTAEVGLLPGAQAAVDELSGAMPALNGLVSTFSGQLGQILPTGIDAVVTGLERAEPLLDAGGAALVQWVQSLDDAAHSQGFENFISYAVQELPEVERLLGDALKLAGDFLARMAPYGGVMLNIADGVLKVADAATPVAPLIFGIWTAFQAIRGAQAILAVATGGVKALGLAALVTAGQEALMGDAAKVAASESVAAGKAGQAAGVATAGGWVAALKTLSLYVAGAAVVAGGVEVGLAVGESLGGTTDGSGDVRKGSVAEGTEKALGNPTTQAGKTAVNQANTTASGYTGGSAGYTIGSGAQTGAEYASAQAKIAAATDAATAASKRQSAAAREQTGALAAAAAAANTEAAAESTAAKAAQTMAGTNLGAKDAIGQMTAAVKANGTSLSENTAKGRANQEAILAAASGISAYGAQVTKATGSATAGQTAMDGMAVSLVKQATAAGLSKDKVSTLVSSLLGMPKSTLTTLLAIDEASPKAKAAAATAKTFSTAKYAAVLEANGVPAKQATDAAQAAAQKWAAAHPAATIDGKPALALAAIAAATTNANRFSITKYAATLEANGVPAGTAIAKALTAGREWATAHPTAKIDGEPQAALAAVNIAKTSAVAFRDGQYEATLRGNPAPATTAANAAKAAAMVFRDGKYEAVLSGDPAPAKAAASETTTALNRVAAMRPTPVINVTTNASATAAAARGAIDSVNGKTVVITVQYNQQGKGSRDYALGGTLGDRPGLAIGGTAADYIRSLPGAAGGLSDGTVIGAGHAASDAAGMFRLANREEVTSNLFGQADRFRPVLKAINSQAVRTPAQLGQALGGGQPQAVHVYVHGDDSALSGAIRVEAEGVVASYERAGQRAIRAGATPRGASA